MDSYQDRKHAGQVLANELSSYANKPHTIILALPRGGVPVGYEIAVKLNLPLDVLIVRKLGSPSNPEFAFGAIASNGVKVLNQEVVQTLTLSKHIIAAITESEQQELERREVKYRGKKKFPEIKGKTVLLVDDGIATGYTMTAAIEALRKQSPKTIIVASPVCALDTFKKLQTMVDKLICPLTPDNFQAVGLWYKIFDQTSDEEVKKLLKFS